MSRWLLVAALLGCWGCAFSLDGPDPKRPRNRVPRCDTSKGLVALDGVMGTAFGVTALAFASNDEPAAALVPLGIGALYIAGAVSGNRSVDACRKAIAEYDLSYSSDERYALGDDEDEDEERLPRRKSDLIPRPVPAGQATVPPRYPTYAPPGGQPPTYAPPGGQPPTYPPPTYPAPGQQPVAQPAPQQPVAQPTPVAPQQPAQPAPPQARTKKQPKAPPSQDEGDEWSDFWREVP